ncbi:MAG: amidohydrolase [Candidatus Eremiobacteraeota bacterium]|nr:amidohydrolase [Candidatus Eremiobacteraeota bacterium]MCW5872445.1 amidohydrolase [Candidatus Eremiobacteraeota bacterium]
MRHFLLMLALAAPVAADPLELYRWFHAHPELSKKETQTSQKLAQELKALGLEVEQGIGGTGLMAILRGQPGGPVVLYRADMDALPVQEATGLPYSSQVPGVMHACGHDLHMACAVAALGELARKRKQWKGTIVFVGQPAEELGNGAKGMLLDPRFQQVLHKAGGQPRLAFALHDNATLPVGQVSLNPGYVSANVDSVDIIVHGLGGHGAHPDTTVDPIVMGSEIVMSLQTIVSRRLKPGAQALVTVGKFAAGSKHNIIPPKAELALTVRSYDEKTRQRLLSEIRHISQNIAASYHAPKPPEVLHNEADFTPSLYNNPDWVRRLRPIFVKKLGEQNLIMQPASMGGEDFSEFSRRLKIPGVMFSLGAVDPALVKKGGPLPGLHSDKFAPAADTAIPLGAELVQACLLEALRDR